MKILKVFLTMTVFFVVCGAQAGTKTFSAFEFLSRFNPQAAKKMTSQNKKISVSRVFAKGSILSFNYGSIHLRFEYNGKENHFLSLNGVAFSKEELKNQNKLKKLIVTRFGLKLKKVSNHRRFASETTVSPLGEESTVSVEDTGSIEERDAQFWSQISAETDPSPNEESSFGAVNFGDAFESREVCLFCDAQEPTNNTIRTHRQRMELAFGMITGEEQQGMLNFMGGWMSGLNSMLSTNTPLDAFMNSGMNSPNSIEMPRYYN